MAKGIALVLFYVYRSQHIILWWWKCQIVSQRMCFLREWLTFSSSPPVTFVILPIFFPSFCRFSAFGWRSDELVTIHWARCDCGMCALLVAFISGGGWVTTRAGMRSDLFPNHPSNVFVWIMRIVRRWKWHVTMRRWVRPTQTTCLNAIYLSYCYYPFVLVCHQAILLIRSIHWGIVWCVERVSTTIALHRCATLDRFWPFPKIPSLLLPLDWVSLVMLVLSPISIRLEVSAKYFQIKFPLIFVKHFEFGTRRLRCTQQASVCRNFHKKIVNKSRSIKKTQLIHRDRRNWPTNCQ